MTPEERQDSSEAEFAEVEAMLRQVPLRRPPARLDGRIAAACRPFSAMQRLWLVTTAAALVAVTAGAWAVLEHAGKQASNKPQITRIETGPKAGSTSAAALKPVSVVRTYGGIARDGVIGHLADGQPVQRIRRQTIQQILIVDPQRGTRVSISVPREDVFVVPVRTF
jgi:hypothetical protein